MRARVYLFMQKLRCARVPQVHSSEGHTAAAPLKCYSKLNGESRGGAHLHGNGIAHSETGIYGVYTRHDVLTTSFFFLQKKNEINKMCFILSEIRLFMWAQLDECASAI